MAIKRRWFIYAGIVMDTALGYRSAKLRHWVLRENARGVNIVFNRLMAVVGGPGTHGLGSPGFR